MAALVEQSLGQSLRSSSVIHVIDGQLQRTGEIDIHSQDKRGADEISYPTGRGPRVCDHFLT
jgi:hypothetical protein